MYVYSIYCWFDPSLVVYRSSLQAIGSASVNKEDKQCVSNLLLFQFFSRDNLLFFRKIDLFPRKTNTQRQRSSRRIDFIYNRPWKFQSRIEWWWFRVVEFLIKTKVAFCDQNSILKKQNGRICEDRLGGRRMMPEEFKWRMEIIGTPIFLATSNCKVW